MHVSRYIIGTRSRALYRFQQMESRCRNGNNCLHKSKGIKVIISKDDFISWFMANDFEGCSVDRIDGDGHYEAGNIQLIPMAENIAKDKVKPIKDGETKCSKCGEWKTLDCFYTCKKMKAGRQSSCVECERKRCAGRVRLAAVFKSPLGNKAGCVIDGKKGCSKCGEWKLLEEYTRDKWKPSGRASRCKECVKTNRDIR
jgi:hypothetical protein